MPKTIIDLSCNSFFISFKDMPLVEREQVFKEEKPQVRNWFWEREREIEREAWLRKIDIRRKAGINEDILT